MKKKNEHITRKEALKKFSKYTALTAIGTFAILNPQKAQAFSVEKPNGPVRDPQNGGGIWGNDKPDSNDKYDSEDNGSIWK